MKIQPFILGSGRSALAIRESLALLREQTFGQSDNLILLEPRQVPRGASPTPDLNAEKSVLFISTPHALHAPQILAAANAGFHAIGCEKPSCVDRGQLQSLRDVSIPVAIYHVYREMWGPKTLKQMIGEGFFGELISLEGRYWQASTAERALSNGPKVESWKNEVQLSGPSDALIDVGVHWLDLVRHLAGENPLRISGWKSFKNADQPHRDSHVQLALDFASGLRAWGSISKTFHGSGNHFEINVIGTRASATWTFMDPDLIWIGEGRERRTLTRKSTTLGTGHPPHHSAGWLEGYLEINRNLLRSVLGLPASSFPTLSENLELLSSVFETRFEEQR